MSICQSQTSQFELLFRRAHDEAGDYAFPCDATGHVDIDALDPIARINYLYARAVSDHRLAKPEIKSRGHSL